MILYIDGDAFPNLLKPIVLKAINRLGLTTKVVANKTISIGRSNLIEYIVVPEGPDVADDYIAYDCKEGDLVITADIPLADRVVSKKVYAIDHRGELYSPDNIKQYLAMRNLMESIRESGELTFGPKPFGVKDAHNFANQLNTLLSRAVCNHR
jgi:uncharacterized protein YaiI (UPF0178 family)